MFVVLPDARRFACLGQGLAESLDHISQEMHARPNRFLAALEPFRKLYPAQQLLDLHNLTIIFPLNSSKFSSGKLHQFLEEPARLCSLNFF